MEVAILILALVISSALGWKSVQQTIRNNPHSRVPVFLGWPANDPWTPRIIRGVSVGMWIFTFVTLHPSYWWLFAWMTVYTAFTLPPVLRHNRHLPPEGPPADPYFAWPVKE